MTKRRILEIIPGFISWNLILFLIWGGGLFPVMTAYFILAFDVFWVWKGFSLTVATFISHLGIKAAEKLDWMRGGQRIWRLAKSQTYCDDNGG